MSPCRLIIFSRHPEPGKAKTRLIPVLGARGAAELQRQMTEALIARAGRLRSSRGIDLEVRYAGGNREALARWLGDDIEYRSQGAGDLGVRMQRALTSALGEGATCAVVAGTDIPGLDEAILDSAFAALVDRDMVLGPAEDGGYYLVGLARRALRADITPLFRDVPWGTGRVREVTRRRAEALGLDCALTRPLADVDRPEDLPVWLNRRPVVPSGPDYPPISVIVPARNEAENLAATLHRLVIGRNVEVIVADGGSSDETRRIAEAAGVRVVEGPAHRARQMNAGAAVAGGAILFFLHADTLPPHRYEHHIRRTLRRPDVVLGAFRLGIDAPGGGLRWVEWWADLRSRRLSAPYGDQGLFINRSVFHRLGGFPDMEIMEDYVLVRRAARRGRVVTLPARVLTSPRRWHRLGVARTAIVNQLVVASYWTGLPPGRMARLYRGKAP